MLGVWLASDPGGADDRLPWVSTSLVANVLRCLGAPLVLGVWLARHLGFFPATNLSVYLVAANILKWSSNALSETGRERLVLGFVSDYGKFIPITGPRMSPVSLFFVTTSTFGHWVICVPAAFLGCGSRF